MRRSLYWLIAPLIVLCMFSAPFATSYGLGLSGWRIVFVIVVEIFLVGALIGLFDPYKNANWLRLSAAVIFFTSVSYLLYTLFTPGTPWTSPSGHQPSVLRALGVFIFWGLPTLLFLIFGKKMLWQYDPDLIRHLLIATTNPHKIEEIAAVLSPLGIEVVGLDSLDDIPPEPVEDTDTFVGNARLKAIEYARATGQTCLADDSGLEVDVLGGTPGVHSARYAGIGDTRDQRDQANNEKLLAALKDIPRDQRTARFVCAMCLADPDGNILAETRGIFPGLITDQPRGTNGFGYDPLLYLPDVDRTSAELSPEEKNARSHRGEATRQMAEKLKRLEDLKS